MAKIELKDYVEYGKLVELYGKLLSEDRQKIMSDYFQFNMTLAEIAKERGVSRQAVLDAIDKSCKKLREFEQKLNFMAKQGLLIDELSQIKRLAEEKKIVEIEEKVEKILKDM